MTATFEPTASFRDAYATAQEVLDQFGWEPDNFDLAGIAEEALYWGRKTTITEERWAAIFENYEVA